MDKAIKQIFPYSAPTRLNTKDSFFSFNVGDISCMLAGMDSLPDLLTHVDEEIQRDAFWIFNKVISNKNSPFIANSPEMIKRLNHSLMSGLRSQNKEIVLLAMRAVNCLSKKIGITEVVYMDEISDVMMKGLGEEIHLQDVISDISLEFFAQFSAGDLRFKSLLMNGKIATRLGLISKASMKYLKENPRIVDNYLNFLSKATSINSLLLNEEATVKFVWQALCTGPQTSRKYTLEILNRVYKEQRLIDAFLNHIPMSEVVSAITAWKKEPENLTEILRVLTHLGNRSERKLTDKIVLHLSLVREILGLIEFYPEEESAKNSITYYDLTLASLEFLTVITTSDSIRQEIQRAYIGDIIKRLAGKKIDDTIKTVIFKFLQAHCYYYNDFEATLQRGVLHLIAANITHTNEVVCSGVLDFLINAADAGYPIKKKIGIEGLLNLDNLFQNTTNQQLKDKLHDLKLLLDKGNDRRERREQSPPPIQTEKKVGRPLSGITKLKSPTNIKAQAIQFDSNNLQDTGTQALNNSLKFESLNPREINQRDSAGKDSNVWEYNNRDTGTKESKKYPYSNMMNDSGPGSPKIQFFERPPQDKLWEKNGTYNPSAQKTVLNQKNLKETNQKYTKVTEQEELEHVPKIMNNTFDYKNDYPERDRKAPKTKGLKINDFSLVEPPPMKNNFGAFENPEPNVPKQNIKPSLFAEDIQYMTAENNNNRNNFMEERISFGGLGFAKPQPPVDYSKYRVETKTNTQEDFKQKLNTTWDPTPEFEIHTEDPEEGEGILFQKPTRLNNTMGMGKRSTDRQRTDKKHSVDYDMNNSRNGLNYFMERPNRMNESLVLRETPVFSNDDKADSVLPRIKQAARTIDQPTKGTQVNFPRITSFPFSQMEGIDELIAENYYGQDFTQKNHNPSRLIRHYMKIGIPEATGIHHLTGASTVEELVYWFAKNIETSNEMEVVANLQKAIGSSNRTAFLICLLVCIGEKKGLSFNDFRAKIEDMIE